jgi:hypothetical protein
MLKSFALHSFVLALLLLVPAKVLLPSKPPKKELDIVFYRAPKIEVPAPVVQPLLREKTAASSTPAPALFPKPNAPVGPDRRAVPELPPGPDAAEQQQQKVGKAGILAFKDQFASLATDRVAPRLGADARYGAADDGGKSSSNSLLTTSTPGSSGGINVASLNHSVGGGGGGGGSGIGHGGAGVSIGRATSPIAAIGGGADRPKARGGPGPARTDEEIQIVFDRYKASFYRLYNRELRNNPALKGQMVLRLTIEPDGSVSMCVLQKSDMDAPDLGAQVVDRVKTINFGAKEGVQAVTIVYPIDFLPAA